MKEEEIKMITDDKRVRMITGYYGSGKTEFALNYISKLATTSKRSAIADLDIVNVFFRSRERAKELEALGIEVISSSMTQDSSDMPALSSKIVKPLRDKSYDYVMDLGGSEIGANVLGRYQPDIDPEEVDFFMVVNVFRPETGTVDEICKQKELLEEKSGLKVTGFINNSNLIHETKMEHILEGDAILKEVVEATKVPVRYTTCMLEEVGQCEELGKRVQGELFPMHYKMRESWM